MDIYNQTLTSEILGCKKSCFLKIGNKEFPVVITDGTITHTQNYVDDERMGYQSHFTPRLENIKIVVESNDSDLLTELLLIIK